MITNRAKRNVKSGRGAVCPGARLRRAFLDRSRAAISCHYLRFLHEIEHTVWKSPQQRASQVAVDFRMSDGMSENCRNVSSSEFLKAAGSSGPCSPHQS